MYAGMESIAGFAGSRLKAAGASTIRRTGGMEFEARMAGLALWSAAGFYGGSKDSDGNAHR